jgi:dTDP-4-amino-4,6-dideoxy-D-galactose acyltransferase
MEKLNADLLAKRASALAFYSPYSFMRGVAEEKQDHLFGANRFAQFPAKPHEYLATFLPQEQPLQLLLAELPWDSEFFGTRTIKLQTALFDPTVPLASRVLGMQDWQQQLSAAGSFYCFSEIPVEDTALLQTLTASGWRLVETRLQFYHDQVAEFKQPRYAVRSAQPEEAEHIGQIAAAARNPYDRFLARYASAAVQGYCDAVLVPNEPGLPVDAFLAISDLTDDARQLGVGLARVVLTAVGPQNRGWHLRLVSETVQRAREQGVSYVLMTTQATNRAVFRTCEKLGFKLGGSTHVLACHHHNS